MEKILIFISNDPCNKYSGKQSNCHSLEIINEVLTKVLLSNIQICKREAISNII